MERLRQKAYSLLRKSEGIFRTDMVYLARGGFWLGTGQFITTLSSFILSVAFANFLSPDEYGIYRYILSTAVILTIPALGGIDTALIQAVARGYDGSLELARKTKFRYGLLGGFAGLALGAYYLYQANTTLGFSFLIAGIFLPFMESLSLYDSVLQGKKNFKLSSLFASGSQFISVALTLALLLFTKNIPVLIFAYFASWTLCRYTALRYTVRKMHIEGSTDPSLISYGKHLSVMGILSTIANYIDRFLVFHFVGAAELAIYSIAIAPPEQLKALFKSVQNLALPKYSGRSLESVQQSIMSKLKLLTLIISVVTVTYIVAAPIIFDIFFPKYVSAVLYSQIFSLSLVAISSSLVFAAMQAHRTQIELYKFNIWTSLSQIVLLIIGTAGFGVLGAIMARVLNRFVILAVSVSLYKSAKSHNHGH